MRRWQKGEVGAMKMGMYYGLCCLGYCWPYFLLMVALGLMMALFTALIYGLKVFFGPRGLAWVISLPFDSMSSSGDS